jgi:ATP phosphoribosyltransferase regulatory subunit
VKKTTPPVSAHAPEGALRPRPAGPEATAQPSGSLLMPPAGMRDLLPPESRARRKVSDQLQLVFERHGYELITTPLFEHVDVFERGLTLDPRDLLRFVEPDSGEIAALRPDMTPQIARVVATRMSELPAPYRLRYEGTVIRRRRGRARRQRQLAQVGIELIGLDGPHADAEVIRVAAQACRAAGLSDFRVELSEVGVGRALLSEHGDALFAQASAALAQKDEAHLLALLERAGVDARARDRIAAVLHLHGDLSVLGEAKRLVAGTAASVHLDNLERVAELLFDMGLGPLLGVDLGEVRGAGYYTGVSFAVFARGPGEAVASGGRYDQLLARYGTPLPATGAGIDVENLLWALDHAGAAWREHGAVRFLVAGDDAARVRACADAIRESGFTAASLPDADLEQARRYASAWSIELAIVLQGHSAGVALRLGQSEQREIQGELSSAEIEGLAAWAREAAGAQPSASM